MNSVASHENVLEAIELIAEYVSASPADEPVEFVRDLARRWKERGGTVAGKPRHSDRYLDDLLRGQGTPIKSLTPKLVGRTHLKSTDAGVLVRLFLSHWDYIGDPNSGEIGARSTDLYKPVLSEAEIEGVCGYVMERITAAGIEAPSDRESSMTLSKLGDTSKLIVAEFKKAIAIFTASVGQTVLVARREMALIGFRNLMNELWAIDEADGQERILIWTLDLGRQDFEDPEARLRFMNVEALISRFKALKRFKDSGTEARWKWLQSRTVIVMHDTRSVPPEVPRLPAFGPHHVLFSAIPPKWAGSPEFLALYGDKLERLHETTYTIFLRKSSEGSLEDGEISDRISSHLYGHHELRYFGHALLNPDKKGELLSLIHISEPTRPY